MNLLLSLFNSKNDNVPKPTERTWDELCRRFGHPPIRAEKDGQLFSPAIFDPPHRANKNVKELSAISLDLDHDVLSVEQICALMRSVSCAFAIYSTHSHLRITESNPKGEPRYRVFLPLREPIPAADYPALRGWVIETTKLPADPAASALANMYYAPAKASVDAPYECHVEEGEFLDWTKVDLSKTTEEKRPPVALPRMNGHGTVDERLRKAFAARNGAETFRLFEGDTSAFGGNKSRADMGLASRLAFFAGNVATLEEMLQRSRLVRDKWNEKHYSDGRSYLQGLVEEAIASCREFYTGSGFHQNLNGNGKARGSTEKREVAEPSTPAFDNQVPWPELNRAALYGLAGDVVRVIEPHTESDPVALLIQILVAFGNAIGRTAYFTAEATRHYLNLFVLLVGLTAKGRKGTSWNHVFRFTCRVDEIWATNCITSSPSSGEALIWVVRDPIEKQEPIREKKGGRVTGYQTVVIDAGVTDKRMLVFMSEFASMLRVMTRDGNTVSTVYRQLWDGDEVVRINNKNSPVKVTGPHLSSIGHITKDEYLRNVDETDTVNGFANRILHVCARRSKCLPEGGSLKHSDLNELVQRFRVAVEFGKKSRELRRDEESAAVWRERYPGLSEGRMGMWGAATSRAEAQVMRLACVYALLDCSSVIRGVHLQAALALWQYCDSSARFVFGDSIGDRLADEILASLREAAEVGLSRTQIRDLFRRNVDADRIGNALRCLSENGLAHSRTEPSAGEKGRPTERWFARQQFSLSDYGVDRLKSDSFEVGVSDTSAAAFSVSRGNDSTDEAGRERDTPVFGDSERQAAWDSWER